MCVICDTLFASNLAVSVCVYLTDKISKHGKKKLKIQINELKTFQIEQILQYVRFYVWNELNYLSLSTVQI